MNVPVFVLAFTCLNRLPKMYIHLTRCASIVTVIGAENRIGNPLWNSNFVCSVHLLPNTLDKGMNVYLLPNPSYRLNNGVDLCISHWMVDCVREGNLWIKKKSCFPRCLGNFRIINWKGVCGEPWSNTYWKDMSFKKKSIISTNVHCSAISLKTNNFMEKSDPYGFTNKIFT